MGFFTDDLGRQTVLLKPNPPILGWAALGAASFMALEQKNRDRLSAASSACLLIWAVLEVTTGRSGFRRSAGVLTLSWLWGKR
ncbi:hypothetical protein E8P82_02325 [Arthrobacter echini]|uniref:Uncharacterized protein n=1 Tax=Arthrobacter echini TaxID=1529066 RepID=A0A4S5EAH4_9MICC|nr:hypothetical protein [Arthrobacter echini]THJ68751.1 hypothetical protein E8P82_02325 [Arthrobacter echini]